MQEDSAVTQRTKQQNPHLLTGGQKREEAIHVAPNTDVSWQLY
jgi:hypothetical protein